MSDVESSYDDDNKLRSDAECLMQSSKEVIKQLGWNWKTPIHKWKKCKSWRKSENHIPTL